MKTLPMLIEEIALEYFIPDPNNENKHTDQDVIPLSNLIHKVGQLHPAYVRYAHNSQQLMLVTGEGRWLALRHLEKTTNVKRFLKAIVIDVDDNQAALIRAAENNARNSDQITECVSFANLHRSGLLVKEIAALFNQPPSTTGDKVAIGYFPENIIKKLRQNSIWKYGYLSRLLPLRTDKEGIIFAGKNILDHPDLISYDEVEKTIDLVNNGSISNDLELRAYVSDRRLALQQKNVEKILEKELENRRASLREEISQELSTAIESQMTKIESKYQEKVRELQNAYSNAIEDARKARSEMAGLVTKGEQEENEAELKLIQVKLSEKQEEIAQKDFQLQKLLIEITNLKKAKDQNQSKLVEEEAEKFRSSISAQLEAEYNREVENLREHYRKLEAELKEKAVNRVNNLVNTIKSHNAEISLLLATLIMDQFHLLGQDHKRILLEEVRQLEALAKESRLRLEDDVNGIRNVIEGGNNAA